MQYRTSTLVQLKEAVVSIDDWCPQYETFETTKIRIGVLEVVGSSGGPAFRLHIAQCRRVVIPFRSCKFCGWCVNALGVKLPNKEMAVPESDKARLAAERTNRGLYCYYSV